ncbi:uncharacterized protein SPSC_00146 [Sporisorium scitamineum]|uniref:Copper acquisition factor BIM1-like domain-containing protein n=1 Tax=Sporisorium scitamineum TaxID=49012 RepID=A0A0F7RXL2_9BASI|nr:hypothetical protein [Sporisorium scitamineum]CDS81964.1 uncharacterized protein SPSC_00146 [Sporisorium scitamineum]
MKLTSTTSALAALALASSAAAHFTLDYPATRGFDEDLENQNFCGGFSDVSLPRQPWYYQNGPVEIDSHHDSAVVNIYISYSVPTSAQSFLAASPLRHDLDITGEGEFCFHANASTTNVAGVTPRAGTNATLMVEFISTEHGHLYQCSDVVFTDDKSVGANVTCTDALTAAGSSGAGANSTTSSTSSSKPAAATSSAAASASSTPKSNSNGAALVSVPMLSLALVPALLAGALSLA